MDQSECPGAIIAGIELIASTRILVCAADHLPFMTHITLHDCIVVNESHRPGVPIRASTAIVPVPSSARWASTFVRTTACNVSMLTAKEAVATEVRLGVRTRHAAHWAP